MAHQQRTLKAKVLGHRNLKVAFFNNLGVRHRSLLVVVLSHLLSFKFLYLPCYIVNRVTAFTFMSYCSIISVVCGLMGEKSLIFSKFQQSPLPSPPVIIVMSLGHGSTTLCSVTLLQ